MKALLIYPLFPKSFWSFEKTLKLTGFKVQLPPLGIITAAALFPESWEFKLVDRNARDVTAEEWEWADLVMLSAMIVQKEDFLAQIAEAKRRGKPVAVGGPYPTAIPQDALEAGAEFLVLDEGEVTIPMFLAALESGQQSGIFRSNGQKPDIKLTPIPRYDLLNLDDYAEMSVQFSRGCPFQCEFCDIIVLYGRDPRTKGPKQLLGELQRLFDLGWRRSIFVVDDNFIGNKRQVKLLLAELRPWLEEHRFPFSFATEASIDLAKDDELLRMMAECRFGTVFLGLETPDAESLDAIGKHQNTRAPLAESVHKIAAAGLRITGGFIIGFDNERPGAGERILTFIEQTSIPTAMLSMLQALPGTALWKRLEREGRLNAAAAGNVNQTTLMNFVPTRPLAQIADEYVKAFSALYEPLTLLNRIYRHYCVLGEARLERHRQQRLQPRSAAAKKGGFSWNTAKILFAIGWRQGVLRKSRWRFWSNLFNLWRRYPSVVGSYLTVCAQAEHFIDYRGSVREEIELSLARA